MATMNRLAPHPLDRPPLAFVHAGPPRLRLVAHCRGALLLCAAVAGAAPCLADVGRAAASTAPLVASAQLDFRITVQPALGLRSDAQGRWLAHSNNGVLLAEGATQADVVAASGARPAGTTPLQRTPVAALALRPVANTTGRALVTVASP